MPSLLRLLLLCCSHTAVASLDGVCGIWVHICICGSRAHAGSKFIGRDGIDQAVIQTSSCTLRPIQFLNLNLNRQQHKLVGRQSARGDEYQRRRRGGGHTACTPRTCCAAKILKMSAQRPRYRLKQAMWCAGGHVYRLQRSPQPAAHTVLNAVSIKKRLTHCGHCCDGHLNSPFIAVRSFLP